MTTSDAASALLLRAIGEGVFPAAVAEVGSRSGTIWSGARGRLTFDDRAPAATLDTLFDLASLAKPIATATLAIDRTRRGALDLDEPVARSFAEWRGRDRDAVTLRDLLEHASGLPARLVDAPPATRREFIHEICTTALEYAPRSRSIYSDLGFILLGFLLEDRDGAALDAQFHTLWSSLSADRPGSAWLGYNPSRERVVNAAPTLPLEGDVRRGRTLVGEVHDNYAAALGGVAGHSGLFGNVPAVSHFARLVLAGAQGDATLHGPFAPDAVRLATTKTSVPGSSRALGWDTMLPTSSCGTRMSAAAFGHVGFTGTSIWIDPVRDRYFVLLTNRVCGRGTLEQMRAVRRSFHDLFAAIDG